MTSSAAVDPSQFELLRRGVQRLSGDVNENRQAIKATDDRVDQVRDMVSTRLDGHSDAIRDLTAAVGELTTSAKAVEGETKSLRRATEAHTRSIQDHSTALAKRVSDDEAREAWYQRQAQSLREDAQKAVAEAMLAALQADGKAAKAHTVAGKAREEAKSISNEVKTDLQEVKSDVQSLARRIEGKLGAAAIVIFVLEHVISAVLKHTGH